ncbi:hypothetical protein [Amorphus sp. MBR-141]
MLKHTNDDEVRVGKERARQGENLWPMKWVLGLGIAAFTIFGFLAWFYLMAEPDQEISPATNGEAPAQSEPATPPSQ